MVGEMKNIIEQTHGTNFSLYNGDCVYFAQSIPDNSIDLTVYSPPFSSLYVYSESVADMGNVQSDGEFIEQYRFLVREKHRFTRPGRVSAVHVKDLVYYQNSSIDGSSGLRPFSDMVTRVHIEEGFTLHCRITIFRDPVLERSKTNAHGLLWKTFQKDASFCRVVMPEYLLIFRKWAKPGDEELIREVKHPKSDIPLSAWQELASPIWPGFEQSSHVWNYKYGQSGNGDDDLPATDVLNVKLARDEKAEKHLCPMPLNITRRALQLYTKGVATLEMGRRFIGTELHPNYYNQAVKMLQAIEKSGVQTTFDFDDSDD
jgi:DNA modification methylase